MALNTQESADAAQRFLLTDTCDPSEILEARKQLRPTHPALARRLSRRLSEKLIRGETMRASDVDVLWKACKTDEAYGLARRVLKRRVDGDAHIVPYPPGSEQPSEQELREQLAMMTSKDPDLAASLRHDWALQILKPDLAKGTAETLGIAGGIYKRRWETDGRTESLEQALLHYRAPVQRDGVPTGDGYPAINAAFVADLLAHQSKNPQAASAYREAARALRQQILDAVKVELEDKDPYWKIVTLAEARFGLGGTAEALPLLERARALKPDPWVREATARQLARLGDLLGDAEATRQAVEALVGQDEDGPARVESVRIGKVGLALSGGGFRASLYHLGVLARLAEVDLLRHVQVISGVSGGSMTAAAYYLRLRHLLQAKPKDASGRLVRSDYVGLVRELIDDFRTGTDANLRMSLLTDWDTCSAVLGGDDDAIAEGMARAVHQALHSRVEPQDPQMAALSIKPYRPAHSANDGEEDEFHPRYHNAARRDKVPALLLNATTLNTGHSWQFTTTSMGESPYGIVKGADPMQRLRRANYHDSSGTQARKVSLAQAVYASACVPGLFAPLRIRGMYEGHVVSLVDGGVHDNQGALALLQEDCNVLLVSDASGQLGLDSAPGGGHVSPVLRSFAIFQERMRQSGFQRLFDAKSDGRLTGLAYTHLKQDLDAPPLDWRDCEDPSRENDQLPELVSKNPHTSYGVWKDHQKLLADIRTDLDVFSEIEAAALMASGYKAMDARIPRLVADVKALEVSDHRERWFFDPLLKKLGAPDEELKHHLEAGATMFLRIAKLDAAVRWVLIGMLVLLGVLVAGLAWRFWGHELRVTAGQVIMALGVPLGWMLLTRLLPAWGWTQGLIDPVGLIRRRARRLFGTVVVWLAAKLLVPAMTRRYLALGRLSQLNQLAPGRETP
jgi:predicted acylesterase/phospholipase RssA